MANWSEGHRHDAMRNTFARAECTCPDMIHETWYSFGGHVARMRIVGNRLAEHLSWTFSHLQCLPCDPSRVEIAIDLWDALETGIAPSIGVLPDPAGLASSFLLSEDERFVTSVLQHSITSFDRQKEHIIGVAFDADRLSLYEYGRPLHVPLSLWYGDRDVPLVHAALVSDRDRGILLVGRSGDGKTTASLSSLAAGLHYLADDLAGLELLSDGDFQGHSVYGSAFVDDETLNHMPALCEHAIAGKYGYEDKKLVFVSKFAPTRMLNRVRIDAVALLRISDGNRTRVRPATKGEALLTLARDGLQIGVLSPGRRGFELLGDLSNCVPSFWVEVGAHSNDISRRICELLSCDSGHTKRGAA